MRAGIERYNRLKEDGTCVICGFRAARPGRVMCPDCAARKAAWKRAHRVRSERPRGAPRRWEYMLIDPDGALIRTGSAAEIANYLGLQTETIYKYARARTIRLRRGWKLERRDIRGDADESGEERV